MLTLEDPDARLHVVHCSFSSYRVGLPVGCSSGHHRACPGRAVHGVELHGALASLAHGASWVLTARRCPKPAPVGDQPVFFSLV